MARSVVFWSIEILKTETSSVGLLAGLCCAR
nr:MAG TPA: hypothetical protein [Caudoviricetes sp.]